MRAHKLLFLNIFVVFCGGCSTVSPFSVETADFVLRGKLAVVEAGESFSARFIWRQQDEDFTIDLWGPLGQGRIRLSGNEQRLAVVDGRGARLNEGPHAEVMKAHLGWTLPLAVLADWVLGAPANGTSSRHAQFDAAGHLVGFEQLDWAIVYAQHREVAGSDGSRWLPRRITASKGDYRVRLVISQWQF